MRQYFNRLPKDGKAPARPSSSINLRPGYIDPDSIYKLRGPTGIERLFLVEIANGNAVDRVAKKIPKYAQAIEARSINAAFDYGNKAVRVLWLFEHSRTLELVQKRLHNDNWAQAFAPHFFLKTLAGCDADQFDHGWLGMQSDADPRTLY